MACAVERRRIHLVCLLMDDVDENAHLVNSLQRRSGAAVQKSLVLRDPTDLPGLGNALTMLFRDPELCQVLGAAGQRTDRFLVIVTWRRTSTSSGGSCAEQDPWRISAEAGTSWCRRARRSARDRRKDCPDTGRRSRPVSGRASRCLAPRRSPGRRSGNGHAGAYWLQRCV